MDAVDRALAFASEHRNQVLSIAMPMPGQMPSILLNSALFFEKFPKAAKKEGEGCAIYRAQESGIEFKAVLLSNEKAEVSA